MPSQPFSTNRRGPGHRASAPVRATRSRRIALERQHPVHGPVRVLGLPVFLHRTPAKVTAPSPLPGQHTREVLSAAGYDAAAIDRLLADKVAAETPLP